MAEDRQTVLMHTTIQSIPQKYSKPTGENNEHSNFRKYN
jgi:hypothetical protein